MVHHQLAQERGRELSTKLCLQYGAHAAVTLEARVGEAAKHEALSRALPALALSTFRYAHAYAPSSKHVRLEAASIQRHVEVVEPWDGLAVHLQ